MIKKGCTFKKQTHKLIYNFYTYFKKESANNGPLSNIHHVQQLFSGVAVGLAIYGDHTFIFVPMICYIVAYLLILLACIIDLILRVSGRAKMGGEMACRVDVTLMLFFLSLGLITATLLAGTLLESYALEIFIISKKNNSF